VDIPEVVADWLSLDDPGDVHPTLIAGAALAAMRASLRRWLTDDGASRLPDHIAQCFDVLGAGLEQVERPK
jgi:hypothetical protein